MATQQISSVLRAPAPASRPYRKAPHGYGKRSAPEQRPPGPADFASLPTRERYIAGYIDHLPDGAAMDIKSLAKDLPLYGQKAVGTALRTLAVAGHLRHVRGPAASPGENRWVTRTYWSRTARDNEWWAAHLVTAPTPAAPAPRPVTETPYAPVATPTPTLIPKAPAAAPVAVPTPDDASAGDAATNATGSAVDSASDSPSVRTYHRADSHTAARTAEPTATTPSVPPAAPSLVPTHSPHPSPAYIALARLGRVDPRLALSAADCTVLEPLATAWFARGVGADHLTHALTSGLPPQVGSPVGLVRRRLLDKLPPALPSTPAPASAPGAPPRRLLVECVDCGRPGPPEALPDGLCRPCRAPAASGAPGAAQTASPDGPPAQRRLAGYLDALRDKHALPA
ncbi:MarR family transcriptional regulator [Streptomyces sp. NBC_01754]|uniref:MarR family transcriptional regulator n=1 Tax=Streptomyces sp. NBC_01754 TaxID=2975930 RepID=UPI002DD86AC2|nr:MarR family transcriptional regulator [Streptomyces sp. NBC_01754]WSC92665.1 MarR family transcriptional regulator [Streptomyces sp. NBC_01754]